MKTALHLTALLITLLLGCSEENNQHTIDIAGEIAILSTPEQHRQYLERISDDDQNVRSSEEAAEITLKYGKDSPEYLAYVRAQLRQDSINLLKVDQYLRKFGYPDKEVVGKEAANAPCLVIHHLTDTGLRNWYFEILYKAYLDGNINDTYMSLYLGRTYAFLHQEQFQMENPYTSKDEINGLIKALGLEEEQARVEQIAGVR